MQLNIFVVQRAFGAVALFLIVSYVSRSWSQHSSDIFIALIALAAMARIVAPMGIDQLVFNTFPRVTCFRHDLRNVLASKVVKVLGGVSLLILAIPALGLCSLSQSLLWLCIWVGSGLLTIGSALLRISGFPLASQMPETLITPLVLMLVVVPSLRNPAIAAIATAVAGVCSVLLAGTQLRSCKCDSTQTPVRLQVKLRPFVPAALAGVTVVCAVKGPVLLASHFLGLGASTALDVASRPAMAASLVTSALGQYFAPHIAMALKDNSFSVITATCKKAGMLSSVFGLLPLFVIILIRPHGFALIFGSHYASAWKFSILLSMSVLVNSVFSLFSVALIMAGYGARVAIANIFYLVITLSFGVLATWQHQLSLLVWGMFAGSLAREMTVMVMYRNRGKLDSFSRIELEKIPVH